MGNEKNLRRCLFSAAAAVVILLAGINLFAMASRQKPPNPEETGEKVVNSEPVADITSTIYSGNFAQAAERLRELEIESDSRLQKLSSVIDEYEQLSEIRHANKQQAYMEQLEKLDKLRQAFYTETEDEPTDMPEPELVDAEDVAEGLEDLAEFADDMEVDFDEAKDFNNPDHLVEAFSVIMAAEELATPQQRDELLNSPFVQKIVQSALDRAGKYEADGKWLDAYMNCYFWLREIYEDNEAYEQYSEKLMQKANIVASFQDSPCESSRERYEGVTPEIFTRSLSALQGNYVEPLDYGKMAEEAINRSKMLGEVLFLSYDQIQEDVEGSWQDKLTRPSSEKLQVWTDSLDSRLTELKQNIEGVTRDKFVNLFRNVLKLNEQTVNMPEKVLIANFSEAALHALDPYTNIVWPKEREDFQRMMTNEFTGIGIEISRRQGLLTVSSLLPGTPAHRSGLNAGDIITHVDDIDTTDMSLNCAVTYITGPEDTEVTLTVRSIGSEQKRDITITRAKISVPTVRGWQRDTGGNWHYMLDPESKIGYVRLTSFGEETAKELAAVLDNLEAEGMQGLVLDLRFNTGGLLNAATDVANKFLDRGLIVSTRPRFGVWTYASADSKETRGDYPIVVLINSSSASASEIVAGALADDHHTRAILVGSRTHGKGSVQGITQYPGGGAQLKYTMAYYHLPSGQRVKSRSEGIDDWGVAPNIEVELTSIELRKMLEVQRQNDVLVKEGYEDDEDSVEKFDIDETIKADPQLAIGLLTARTMLIEQQSEQKQLAESK